MTRPTDALFLLIVGLPVLAACGGDSGLVANIDTPLFDVELARTPAGAETDAEAQPEAAEPAPAPEPANTTITNTVGQDNAIVVTGDLTLALPPGVTLQEALQGVVHAPEPPQDIEPGPRGEADAEADPAAGQGQTAGTKEAGVTQGAPAAPENLLGHPELPEQPAAADSAAELYLPGVGEREGFRAQRYCDGRFVAIGHGHLVIDPATGQRLLCEDWEQAQADAEWAVPAWLWEELDPVRRDVLSEIAYMTGRRGLSGFSRMNVALYQRDYPRAAAEILASTLGCPANQPYLACVAEPNARRSYLAELMEAGQP